MKVSNPKKFKVIKERIADLQRNHSEEIKENKFCRIAMGFVAEAEWLLRELERVCEAVLEEEEAAA